MKPITGTEAKITEAYALTIRGDDGQTMVKVHYNGRVEFSDNADVNEAAVIFWKAISEKMPVCKKCGARDKPIV